MPPAEDPTDPVVAEAETDADAKSAPDRAREGMPTWALLLVALPMFYVLSVGPVVKIGMKSGLPPQTLKEIYAPLIWLHDHTVLEQPLEWYIALWGVK